MATTKGRYDAPQGHRGEAGVIKKTDKTAYLENNFFKKGEQGVPWEEDGGKRGGRGEKHAYGKRNKR